MTCHITGPVVILDGTPAANRQLTIRSEDFIVNSQGTVVVLPEELVTYTDLLGEVSFDLMPGSYSGFYVSSPDGRTAFRLRVPDDTPTATFSSLLVASSVSYDPALTKLILDANEAIQNGGGGGGSTSWGNVTGTLSSQTDLQEALDSKLDSSDIGTLSYTIGSLQNRTVDDVHSSVYGFERAKASDTPVTTGSLLGKFTWAGDSGGEPRYAWRDGVFVQSVSGNVVRGKRKMNVTAADGSDWPAFTFSAEGYLGIGNSTTMTENSPSMSLDVDGQAGFEVYGGRSWKQVTSVSGGLLTVDNSYIALNVSGGVTISSFVGPTTGSPEFWLRNSNSTAVTLVHGTSSLRLPGATNITLPVHHMVKFVRVSGNVYQMEGQDLQTALTLKANVTDVLAGLATKADVAHTHTFDSLTSKPTDIAGYGITDAVGLSNTQTITGKKHFSEPVTLVGRTSDPSSHTEGEVWYNTSEDHIKANIGGSLLELDSPLWSRVVGKPTTLSGYGITDALEPFRVQPVSGEWTPNFAAGANATMAANELSMGFWVVPSDMVITDVGISVTSAGGAGTLAKVAIYDTHSSKKPRNLLAESPTMDVASIGMKSATLSAPLSLTKGQVLWLGVRASGSVTITRGLYTEIQSGMGTIGTWIRNSVSRSVTFATGAPSSWTWTNAEFATPYAPLVLVKVQ